MSSDGRSLEVCREFTRDRCKRSDEECRYAHPPSHVVVNNGRVICCVDSLKGRCTRDNPPCRFMHPPAHLQKQLLEFGRSNRMGGGGGGMGDKGYGSSSYSGGGGGGGGRYSGRGGGGGVSNGSRMSSFESYDDNFTGLDPYLASTLRGYKAMLDAALTGSQVAPLWNSNQSFGRGMGGSMFGGGGDGYRGGSGGMGNGYGGGRGGGRGMDSSRSHSGLEVCREFLRGRCTRKEEECRYAHPGKNVLVSADNTVTPCMDFIGNRCTRDSCKYFHAPEHLQAQIRGDGGRGGGRGRSSYGGGGSRKRAQDADDGDDYEPAAKRSYN